MARFEITDEAPKGRFEIVDGPTDRPIGLMDVVKRIVRTGPLGTLFSPNVQGGSIRGAGSIGATAVRPFESSSDNQARRQSIDDGLTSLIGSDPNSMAYQGTKLGAEVLGTSGAGGVFANLLGKVPGVAAKVPMLLESLRTSGLSLGGSTGSKAADMGVRMLGGAGTGAASAAAIDPTDAGTGALIGAATPPVMMAAGRVGQVVGGKLAARHAEKVKEFNRNAPRNNTVKASVEAGYVIPPNMVNSSLKNQIVESISGKQATQQIASLRNSEVSEGLARKALGLADDAPLTKEAMQAYRSGQHQTGYAPLKSLGTVSTDGKFVTALDDLTQKYTGKGTIPATRRNDIVTLVDSFKLPSFDSSDAVDAIAVLRESADEAFRKGDTAIAKAYKGIATAYEDALERQVASNNMPELLDAYRAARTNMAKSYTVEKAIRAGSGKLDVAKIAGELQRGRPLTGELRTIGEFANAFPTIAKSTAQMGSPATHNLKSIVSGLAGAGGAGAGAAMGGAALAGPLAAVGAMAPFVVPAAARSMMFRQGAQKGLVQTAPAEGKIAQLAGLLQDPELQQFLTRGAPAISGLLGR